MLNIQTLDIRFFTLSHEGGGDGASHVFPAEDYGNPLSSAAVRRCQNEKRGETEMALELRKRRWEGVGLTRLPYLYLSWSTSFPGGSSSRVRVPSKKWERRLVWGKVGLVINVINYPPSKPQRAFICMALVLSLAAIVHFLLGRKSGKSATIFS